MQQKIVELYHRENGVPVYRMMCDYLLNLTSFIPIILFINTCLNWDCVLLSVKRKPTYVKGTVNKMLPNLLNRNFKTEAPNEIWCTDFTDLPQKNGTMHYNCTIIDLYDRCAVATLNEKHITTELAIETLKTALKRHKPSKGLILHSDQGSQFTSKAFNDFCKKNHV